MLVALVGTARADPAPPIDWDATAPAPSLPSLAAPGTLYLLDASGARPSCVAWRVEPDEQHRGRLNGDGVWFEFHSSGAVLELTHVQHFTGAVPPWQPLRAYYRDAGATCDLAWNASERDGVIDLGGPRWFRSQAACTAAIAHRAPVATDLSPCLPALPTTPREAAATRRRFAHVLAHGGALYEPERCTAVHVDSDAAAGDTLGGVFERLQNEDADCRYWIREQYELTGDRLVLASDGLRTEKKRASCRDAGSYVTSDAHDEPVAFGAGVIAHGAARFYLTRDACRADAATRKARARWFAAPPPP